MSRVPRATAAVAWLECPHGVTWGFSCIHCGPVVLNSDEIGDGFPFNRPDSGARRPRGDPADPLAHIVHRPRRS